MAYEKEYQRTNQNPMGYGDAERPRTSSRGILITLGIIGLIIAAIVVFSSLEASSPDLETTGTIQSDRMDNNTAVTPNSEPALPGTTQPAPSGTADPADEGVEPVQPVQPAQ